MHRKNHVHLHATPLEARETPAVFAHFGGGTLTVTITDSNSGPAGARLISPHNSSDARRVLIAADDNGSLNRVRINGAMSTTDNKAVTNVTGPNLLRKAQVQRIVVNGSNGNDSIRLDIGPGLNFTAANGWNDLNGDVTIRANGGNDIVKGSGYRDYIYGGYNNDLLEGRNGNDYLNGGSGNDTFNGGSGNDSVAFFHGSQDSKNSIEYIVNY